MDTFFALKAWAEKDHLTYPLLSDFNKDVIRAYGVVNPDMIGLKDISKRAVFVVDQAGIVRHAEVRRLTFRGRRAVGVETVAPGGVGTIRARFGVIT